MTIMVFDIETVPDAAAAKQLLNLPNFSDQDAISALQAQRRETVGHEFMQHYLHQVVAISVVVRHQDWIKVWSLGNEDDGEHELLTRFVQGIERYTPTLVSWNGAGFDLPVLHHRMLLQGVQAPQYWENGENDQQFKWNNYLSRYHYRHLDVMDVLAGYQGKANAPLDDIALLCGFPGKMGLKGNQVLENYLAGHIQEIRNYCESDVLNTYLVFLRFQLMRGRISDEHYVSECQLLKDTLQQSNLPHLLEFNEKWQKI